MMGPSECRKCGRIVYWGARTCPYCGCESPTGSEPIAPKRRVRKGGRGTSAFAPPLLSDWWWVVILLLLAATAVFGYIYDWVGLGRLFGN